MKRLNVKHTYIIKFMSIKSLSCCWCMKVSISKKRNSKIVHVHILATAIGSKKLRRNSRKEDVAEFSLQSKLLKSCRTFVCKYKAPLNY